MPLYIVKALVWNTEGYKKPSGEKVASGWPSEVGYGGEEWNHSDHMLFKMRGREYRAFNTEGLGNKPIEDFAGDIMVFMISSHAGNQYLVAVAGKATAYTREDQVEDRRAIRSHLDFADRWKDAWDLPSVRELWENDKREFRREWNAGLDWNPRWYSPSDYYLALREPLLLDPMTLTGKSRLFAMFKGYQEVDRTFARRVLSGILKKEDTITAKRLLKLCDSDDDDIPADIIKVKQSKLAATTRQALIDARVGQGQFRDQVLALWKGQCALTGCTLSKVLRASHIKPWKISSNRERLDPENGLPLAAHIDAMFDNGLIGFQDDGTVIVSPSISKKDRKLLLGGATRLTQAPSQGMRKYLEMHRKSLEL